MTTPTETEIKLDLEGIDVATLSRRLGDRFGPGAVQQLRSVYFDTEDLELHRQRVTLRVRDGETPVQTVKAGSGLLERDEWEVPVAGDQPDLHAARHTPVHDILRRSDDALQPVFETVVRRVRWLVERPASSVEIALDEGEVRAPDRSAPIRELELELKAGQPSDVFALLREIDPDAELRIGVRSKSERGYELLRPRSPQAFKAETAPLRPGMTAEAAFAAIVGSCLRQIRLNEPLLSTRGSEPLHQCRVGLRRLRSALSLFKEMVSDGELVRLNPRLRAVSRVLGEARDLDVYLERSAAAEADRNPQEPGATAYRAAIAERREAAFTRMLGTVSSPDYRRLMVDILAWAEAGPWRSTADPLRRATREQPIEQAAAAILDRRRRALKKKGRHLATLDPDARHRARIAAKKLRYAADFVTGIAMARKKDRKRHDAFVDTLADLQSALGDLNDIRVGADLALDYARGGEPESAPTLLFAAGHVSGQQDGRVAALLDQATHSYRAVVRAKPFWRGWA